MVVPAGWVCRFGFNRQTLLAAPHAVARIVAGLGWMAPLLIAPRAVARIVAGLGWMAPLLIAPRAVARIVAGLSIPIRLVR
ncbi:hypothetical protein MSIMFI_01360 [Mycobacterium simulans]|nr:hypothetical protein MSIMFI_01360 [Mycobacterium simulans]